MIFPLAISTIVSTSKILRKNCQILVEHSHDAYKCGGCIVKWLAYTFAALFDLANTDCTRELHIHILACRFPSSFSSTVSFSGKILVIKNKKCFILAISPMKPYSFQILESQILAYKSNEILLYIKSNEILYF